MNEQDEALVRRVVREELNHYLGDEEAGALLKEILTSERDKRRVRAEMYSKARNTAVGAVVLTVVGLLGYIGKLILDDVAKRGGP